MDVRKWLDETVQPDHPQTLTKHSGVGPREDSKKPAPVASKRRRRKRSKSDSSLLDVSPQRQETHAYQQKPPTEHRAAESACSEASHDTCSVSSGTSTSSQQYARRPRRKTRPERYDPLAKPVYERVKHAHRNREDESKISRRKSKHKKRNKSGSGMVQSFQAKNVTGDRLTLKPRERLGLFNKGKTSAAVKGRGLPDLVFTEMKFLQKHEDQPEIPVGHVAKKKRKQSHVHSKEGEISAYFAAVRPVLAEKDKNSSVEDGQCVQNTMPSTTRRKREQISAVKSAIPTIEMPDQATYLGFGSRGPCHGSTSYVTWSDSNRAVSATPACSQRKPTTHNEQIEPADLDGAGPKADVAESVFIRPAAPAWHRQTTEGTTENFNVSSMDATHHRMSRSHSCPQHTSSPKRPNLVDRAAKLSATTVNASTSSMPPIMPVHAVSRGQRVASLESPKDLKFEATRPSSTKSFSFSFHGQPVAGRESVKTRSDVRSSSDFEQVLQHCNDTLHAQRREATPRRDRAMRVQSNHSMDSTERHADNHSYPAIYRIPTVRFLEVDSRAPTRASFAGPSIYEAQAQRQQRPMRTTYTDSNSPHLHDFEQDHLTDVRTVSHHDYDWEDPLEEALSLDFEVGQSETYDMENAHIVDTGGQQGVRENDVVAPGFWRPNRLY